MLIINPGGAGPPNPAGPHSTAVAATTVVMPLSSAESNLSSKSIF